MTSDISEICILLVIFFTNVTYTSHQLYQKTSLVTVSHKPYSWIKNAVVWFLHTVPELCDNNMYVHDVYF